MQSRKTDACLAGSKQEVVVVVVITLVTLVPVMIPYIFGDTGISAIIFSESRFIMANGDMPISSAAVGVVGAVVFLLVGI